MATIAKKITANGRKSYYARVRIKGHPQQAASFKRLSDAKNWVVVQKVFNVFYFCRKESRKIRLKF